MFADAFYHSEDSDMRISGVVSNSNIYDSNSKRRIGLKNKYGLIRDQYIHSDISMLQTYSRHERLLD